MGDTNGVELPINHGAKITVTTRLSLVTYHSTYLSDGINFPHTMTSPCAA